MEISSSAVTLRLWDDLSHYLTLDQLDLLTSGKEINCDASLQAFRAFSIGRSFFKKLKPADSSALDAVALGKFLDCNAASRDWRPQETSSWHDELVGTFRNELYQFWYAGHSRAPYDLIFSEDDIWSGARTGPGAAIAARGTDFYTKLFASPLSCSNISLYQSYRRYFSRYPVWAAAEEARCTKYGEPRVVKGSRLAFVPKNDTTSRTICTEPGLNVFGQLGLAEVLNSQLRRRYGIDLAQQQWKNRRLALRGSKSNLRGVSLYATLDLESASDTISYNMVKQYLPAPCFRWLEWLRCPVTSTPKGEVELGMFSSMGNGYTFSLQTILFSAVVCAVYRTLGIKTRFPRGNSLGNFGVNGDDIVVRSNAVHRVEWLLQHLGFRVNRTKSFSLGPFRESCGGDYFNGHSVRGVYVKTLETEQARYVAINRLVQFSARTGIYLPRVMRYLRNRVEFRPIPWWEDDSAGIKTLGPVGLKRSKRYQSTLYRALRPPRYDLRIHEDYVSSPRSERSRYYNPDGLLVAYLHGSVRSNKISLRQKESKNGKTVRWRVVKQVAPNWDCLPPPDGRSEMSWSSVTPQSIRSALTAYSLG